MFSLDLTDRELSDYRADMAEMEAEMRREWEESMEDDAALADYDLERGSEVPPAQWDVDF